MGCSTFANFTVLPEIALAKIRPAAPFDKICYVGCGVTTGIGAVINTAKVGPGATAPSSASAASGSTSSRARLAGAVEIIGIDLNPEEKPRDRFGMTHFVNPAEVGGDVDPARQRSPTKSAAPTTLRLHRQRQVMRQALECRASRLGPVDRHRRRRRRA